jgi:threonine/homoserine/homoserine lactone efflux protein
MPLQTWWLFLCAVFLLSGTPGPNMLHVLTRSVRFGLGPSVPAALGCLSALLIVLTGAAAGLSATLAASPVLFEILRYAGVAYLIYLGLRCWRGGEPTLEPGAARAPRAPTAAGLFRGGLLVGLSNPKLLMFTAAFLPQFVDPARAQGPQFAVLIATFLGVETFWFCIYGLGGRRIARLLTRPRAQRLFDRATGAIFLGFGAALLGTRH